MKSQESDPKAQAEWKELFDRFVAFIKDRHAEKDEPSSGPDSLCPGCTLHTFAQMGLCLGLGLQHVPDLAGMMTEIVAERDKKSPAQVIAEAAVPVLIFDPPGAPPGTAG